MRGAPRALAVAVLLGALAAAVALVVAPRLVERADLPGRMAGAMRAATGRELRLGGVHLAWLPPALRVEDVSLPAPDGGPSLEADALVLRLEPADLLAGRVTAREIEIEALRGSVTIAAAPAASERTGAAQDPARAPDARAPLVPVGAVAGPRALGAERVSFRGGRFELTDARVAPPVRAVLVDLRGSATATGAAGGVALDLAARLESGGEVRLRAGLGPAGELDAEMTLSGVDLAALSSYLGAGAGGALAGRLDGVLRAQEPAAARRVLRFEGSVAGARMDLGSARLAGPLGVTLDLAGLDAEPATIAFEVDATAAEAVYAGGFRKPPGSGATATGRLVVRGGAAKVDDVRILVKNVAASGLPPGARGDRPEAGPAPAAGRAALEREVDGQLVPGAGRALLDAMERVVPDSEEEVR